VKYAKEAEGYAAYGAVCHGRPGRRRDDGRPDGLLEQHSPKSKYLDDGYEPYLAALTLRGKDDAIPGIAEKAIVNFPTNPDLLYVLASTAQSKKQADRAIGFANRLVAAANSRPKPESVSAGDWRPRSEYGWAAATGSQASRTAKRTCTRCPTRPACGASVHQRRTGLKWAPRSCYLGVANYQLGTMTNNKKQVLEGAAFQRPIAPPSKGPYQHQAWLNSQNIKGAADKMR